MSNIFVDELKRTWVTSLIGAILFFGSIWVLIMNEGTAVHIAASLDEAFNNVIILNPYDKINPEYEGRLVHITGELIIDEPLTEPDYGISVQSVKLKRRVQMYQWVEEVSENYGDQYTTQSYTNYYYTTEWRDKLVDSSRFYIRAGHQNPSEIPLKTHTYIANVVKIGYLTLGNELKRTFNDYVEMTSDERPERRDVKLHLGIYYHCIDVWKPEVGDIRVQFYFAGHIGDTVSVVAQLKQGMLIPFYTSKNHKILLLRSGSLSVAEMFQKEHGDMKRHTWLIRGVGWFVLFAATNCWARLLWISLSKLPMFRRLISNTPTTSMSFTFSFSVALSVISVAWIVYRPALGAALLLTAISPIMYSAMGVFNENNYDRI